MGQSLAKNYLHIIFSTKHRRPSIDSIIEGRLHDYIGGICRSLECQPIRVGGYDDHIHILCLLSKKISLVTLMKELKSNSSKWIKTQGEQYKDFFWQDGYGAFSVSNKQADSVKNYIMNQREHHSRVNFKDEYRTILDAHEIDYNEKYVWD